MTPAPARARARTHARTTVAPRGPRRVSGPVQRRIVAAPAVAAAPPGLARRGTTSVFARVRALPEHRVIDRLLRSRLWIWALGALLGGIVAMQVSLLKLNSGISRAVTTTTTLERQNAGLEAAIARLSSTDRVEAGAQSLGMLMPPAGDVSYLSARPEDPKVAVRRMQRPSEEAAALLANGGIVPGSIADPTVATPAETTVTPETPVTSVTPETPVTSVTTVPPPETTTTTAPAGAAVAGQG